ncbi:MAG: flagellar basal-body MS-ring/collar protein FliF [Dehalococcoidia bacterium]
MDQLPRRFFEAIGSLSPARKAVLAGMGGATVALGILLYSWSSQTAYVPLYAGLDDADSGQIVSSLRAQGVPFELESAGSTILVPESQVDELRMGFAAQGLPEGGNIGFELFDGNAFTATDFVQRLNFQRGLQGELARTIETFPSVEHARVHIVIPERSLFVADERPATASVVLAVRPGRTLAADQVAGIAHLVSGAVEGLEKSNITIVSDTGSVLYDGTLAEETGIGVSATQLDMQRTFEQTLEHDVQQLLDRSLGTGRSAVQVRATLNFDRLETETESFAPGATATESPGLPRSTTSVQETYQTTGDASTGAVPGAVANVPGADGNLAPLPEGVTTNYNRTETTSNFEVDRTVTRTTQAPGGVERLSVSLLLDESVPPEQATSLQDAVAAAVGIDSERGDQIVVSRLPFDRTVADAAAEAFASDASQNQLLSYARMALPVVALIVGFIFFRLLVRSVSRRGTYTSADMSGGAMALGGGPVAQALGAVAAKPSLPSPEPERRSEVESQVQAMAKNNPDSVAEVVQAWLRED